MKLISNYHTHTSLCKHATGNPIDYVEQAIKEGCSSLGFSDHCPYRESFYDSWQEVRMSESEVLIYLSLIEKAKEKAPFPIYTGFECEWDSSNASWYSQELKGRYNAQYLILGSHWLSTGTSHIYCKALQTNAQLNKYIDQTIQGMKTGLFAFLAHPDLFMSGYKEWDNQAKSCCKAIIDAAKDLDMPLEINGLGLSREPMNTQKGMRYQYPYLEFWEMAKDAGVKVICNSDAHNSKDVIMNAWKARDFCSRFGITPIDNLNI